MDDLSFDFKGYNDTYRNNYLSGIPSINQYQDENNSEESNFTLIGTSSTTNATPIAYQRDEFLAKIEQSVLCLIFILTISGNFLVLMGIYFRNQKMSRMYYFIVHLSIADLTTAFFNVLTQLFWEFTHRFQGGEFMCKFVKYFQLLGPYSSSYILVVTALDRYQAICYPLSNCSWTAGRSKLMLGTAWVLSFLFSLPQIHIFSFQEITPGGVYDCWGTFEPHWGEKAYITWYCITVFIIPLIILIFAYTCITRVIWLNFSMKNAILKEECPSKRMKRVDSDDMEEVKLDEKGFEENDSPGFRQRGKYSSEKDTNTRNFQNSLPSNAGESISPKNLEVCWHQRKQSIQARASLKIPNKNVLPTSHNNRCQSCSETLLVEKNTEIITTYGNTDYKDPLQLKQSLMSLSHESHATVIVNGTIQNPSGKANRVDKSLASGRRRTWNSVSAKFNTRNNSEVTTQELDFGEPNGEYRKKNSKQYLLGTFQKRQKASSQASKSHIVKKASTLANNQPRTHSVKGISRAKIKTVKLTVTVICCYIVCSTPFIAALLWSAYDPYAKEHPFFFGPTFTILTLLSSLNSCVNAWIVLFFNPNLFQSFVRGTCRRNLAARERERQGGPISMSVSLRRPQNNKSVLVTKNSHQMTVTSMVGLSPLMSRVPKSDNLSHRSSGGRETMELIPPAVSTSRSESLSSGEGGVGGHGKTDRKSRDGTIPIETSFIAI